MLSEEKLKELDNNALRRAKASMETRGIRPTQAQLAMLEWGIALGSAEALKMTREDRQMIDALFGSSKKGD